MVNFHLAKHAFPTHSYDSWLRTRFLNHNSHICIIDNLNEQEAYESFGLIF